MGAKKMMEYDFTYDFIGWCRSGVHDKVYSVLRLGDENYIAVYGRRGKKLTVKPYRMSADEMRSLVRSKSRKGYMHWMLFIQSSSLTYKRLRSGRHWSVGFPVDKQEFWEVLSSNPRLLKMKKVIDAYHDGSGTFAEVYDACYETDLKIVAHHSRVVRVRDCFTNEVYAEKDQKTNKLTWFF